MQRISTCVTALVLLAAGCGDNGTTTVAGTESGTTAGTGSTIATTEPTTTESMTEPTAGTTPGTMSESQTSTLDPTSTSTSTTEASSTETGMSSTTTAVTATNDTTEETSSSSTMGTMGTMTGDTSTTGEACTQGEIVCEGGSAKVCDGMGGFSSEEVCAKECVPKLGGCVECVPDSGYCEGEKAFACKVDGTGYDSSTCDGLQGVTCNPDAGTCEGACSAEALGTNYIGCDYYPTVTPNPLLTNTNIFTFAVAVSNTTNAVANVTVTRGPNMIAQVAIQANSVGVIPLPWVSDLLQGGNDVGVSHISVDGAYRLRSTQPVTVYQYNPLQYTANGQFSYTNDASLLLPRTAWRNELMAVAWNHFAIAPNWSSFYAVVAAEDNTMVTLGPSASGKWVKAGAGVQANGTGNVMLNSSDVLIVFSANANQGDQAQSDPTGTLVTGTNPLQVIGGHTCVYIPANKGYCDHMEESMPPLEAVGKDYFVSVPLIAGPNTTKARMVRITATEANTVLAYEPAIGAPTTLTNVGDNITINATTQDFRVTSEQKIMVSEYMQGQDAGGNKGDPAMTLAVPVEQYRTSYLVHAPTNYTDSFANIVAPTGSNVTVDGVAVANWTAIGASNYSVARIVLSNAMDGNHNLEGDKKFGIQVYGFGQFTSYWYPGGQNLDAIPQ